VAKAPVRISMPDKVLLPEEMRRGINRLDRLISDVQMIDPTKVSEADSHIFEQLRAKIDEALSAIFGNGTFRYNRYVEAGDIGVITSGSMTTQNYRDQVRRDMERTIGLLSAARAALVDDQGASDSPAYHGAADQFYSPTVTVTPPQPPTLAVTIQRGRLELVDPPQESPLKYNRLADELPDKLAAVTRALVDLTAAVKGDNSVLGDVLKRQLAVLLEVTAAELKAPYADTSRLRAAADTFKNIAVQAAQKGGAEFIKGKLDLAAAAIVEAIKGLFQ